MSASDTRRKLSSKKEAVKLSFGSVSFKMFAEPMQLERENEVWMQIAKKGDELEVTTRTERAE